MAREQPDGAGIPLDLLPPLSAELAAVLWFSDGAATLEQPDGSGSRWVCFCR